MIKYKEKWAAAGLMLILSAGPIAGSYLYARQAAPATAAEEITADTDTLTWTEPEVTTTAIVESATEESWNPTPGELNLVHFFPEGTDQTDMTKSLAGEAFKSLMTHDVDWMNHIYDYSDITPAQMAARLGRSANTVTGHYNPKDSAHDKSDPGTWTINSFKRIRMTATDGDGNAITPYSNVLSVMSMANLYTYFKGVEDYDLFLSYSKKLWELSHSYSVSMSDVYYCDGCMSEDSELKEMEELEAQAKAVALGLAKEEEDGTITLQTSEENASSDSDTEAVADTASDTTSDTADVSNASQIRVIEAGKSKMLESSAEESLPSAETGISSEHTEPESTSGVIVSGRRSATAEASVEETLPVASENTDSTAAEAGQASTTPQMSETDIMPEEATTSNAAVRELKETKKTERESGASEHLTDCPGHVDLIIHMEIIGLNEKKNLFTLDSIGNDTENIMEAGWPGWNQYTMASARLLSTQDWFKKYGLTVSSISSGNPLTEGEIEAYMAELPSDLSKTRQEIIRYALSSVGRVPYYWGGKPSAPNYAANSFGILTSPDEKGRVLKGLDCSGWINWIYWSATGRRLAYESTSGLAVLGTKINRGDLKPGDIIVRTGTDAHVIMFLGWTADGRIRCIHESSASVNNVTVGIRDANWPYYRKLVE